MEEKGHKKAKKGEKKFSSATGERGAGKPEGEEPMDANPLLPPDKLDSLPALPSSDDDDNEFNIDFTTMNAVKPDAVTPKGATNKENQERGENLGGVSKTVAKARAKAEANIEAQVNAEDTVIIVAETQKSKTTRKRRVKSKDPKLSEPTPLSKDEEKIKHQLTLPVIVGTTESNEPTLLTDPIEVMAAINETKKVNLSESQIIEEIIDESLPKPDMWEEELSENREQPAPIANSQKITSPETHNESPIGYQSSQDSQEEQNSQKKQGASKKPKRKYNKRKKETSIDKTPKIEEINGGSELSIKPNAAPIVHTNLPEPEVVKEEVRTKEIGSSDEILNNKKGEKKSKKKVDAVKPKKLTQKGTTVPKRKLNLDNVKVEAEASPKLSLKKEDREKQKIEKPKKLKVEGETKKTRNSKKKPEVVKEVVQTPDNTTTPKNAEDITIKPTVDANAETQTKLDTPDSNPSLIKRIKLPGAPKWAKSIGLKPILIVISLTTLLLLTYFLGLPYGTKLYNWTMGTNSSVPTKENLLDTKNPPTKEEKKIIDQSIDKKEVKTKDGAVLEVVNQNRVTMDKAQVEKTPLGVKDLQPKNLKQEEFGSKTKTKPPNQINQPTAVAKTYTKWPQTPFQFIRVRTKISDIYTSKINPHKKYIKIEDPNDPAVFITAETSTPTLVSLIDRKEIEPGDNATITLTTINPTSKQKYLRERETVCRWFNTSTNQMFSIEEYEIPKE